MIDTAFSWATSLTILSFISFRDNICRFKVISLDTQRIFEVFSQNGLCFEREAPLVFTFLWLSFFFLFIFTLYSVIIIGSWLIRSVAIVDWNWRQVYYWVNYCLFVYSCNFKHLFYTFLFPVLLLVLYLDCFICLSSLCSLMNNISELQSVQTHFETFLYVRI